MSNIKDTAEHISLPYGKSTFHCLKMGTGDELLLAFHGYGERCSLFRPLIRDMPERFTLYAVDLPMHGQTWWRGKRVRGEAFTWLIRKILKREDAVSCSLMGFSFGGRLALYLTEQVPHLVGNLYLIAPDGIAASGIYSYVQRVPYLVKRLTFRFLVNGPMARLATKLYSRGWLSHHNHRFVEVHFSNFRRRRRLLVYWLSLDGVTPDWEKVRMTIREHGLKVKLFLATRDEIIPSKAGKLLTEGVDSAEIIFLNANHNQVRKVFFKRASQFI
jgi:pimeloyl-ACP methyl ester carboxylesterase